MKPATPRLSTYPYVVVRVACRQCPHRSGSYRLARLAAKYGPETSLSEVLARIAFDCPWRHEPAPGRRSVSQVYPKCRVHFPDLEHPHPPPPDVPPSMVKLRVVRGGKA